tara:strand:- start:351 stop:551 length:201 start_codon:yes stop_codon:yes gene_type:complete
MKASYKMKIDFYTEDTTEGKQLVIVFEKAKRKYEQRIIGLLKDIKVSEKQAEKIESLLIDLDYIKA